VSAVPDLLLSAVERTKMQNPYLVPQNLGLARLLSQVLTSKSIASFELGDYMGATAGLQAATLSQMYIDASGYSTACQSIIAANVNVSAGCIFLPATLQSSCLFGNCNSPLSRNAFPPKTWFIAKCGDVPLTPIDWVLKHAAWTHHAFRVFFAERVGTRVSPNGPDHESLRFLSGNWSRAVAAAIRIAGAQPAAGWS